eukprot:4395487-Ditylum_brightwellii.AAC.1
MGQHLMVLLSQVQLVSGSAFPYLDKVETNNDYVPYLWLSGIRRYLVYAADSINIHKTWLPALQYDYNSMLMDIFAMAKPGTTICDADSQGVVVTSKMQDILCNTSNCANINNYVRTKTSWSIELMAHIQCDAIGKAFDKLSLYNRIRVLKFQHNWLPTAVHLHDIYSSESP